MKSGEEAMRQWDPTWIPEAVPEWMADRLRNLSINAASVQMWGDAAPLDFPPTSAIDHWGKIRRGEQEFFITQPYGNVEESVSQIAADLRCRAICAGRAPWHPMAAIWIFEPIA